MTHRIGIDVGGTFTDFLVIDDDGSNWIGKSPTTPASPSEGVFAGLETLAGERGRTLAQFLADTRTIVHGTTIATNAVLTGRGARVGLSLVMRAGSASTCSAPVGWTSCVASTVEVSSTPAGTKPAPSESCSGACMPSSSASETGRSGRSSRGSCSAYSRWAWWAVSFRKTSRSSSSRSDEARSSRLCGSSE